MPNTNQSILKVFSAFLIGFFLVMTLLTSLVAIPKINKSFEKQHALDSAITLEIEMELFKRFTDKYRDILTGLADFPVITSAALLSSADNANLIDLVDNFTISGKKARLILQNIAGDIFYQTVNDVHGNFNANAHWFKPLLNSEVPYHFELLGQENDDLRFTISIPITYEESVEGILSAEITAPINSIISSRTIAKGAAFKIQQGNVIVKTDTSNIILPREISKHNVFKNLIFTYISDDTDVLKEQNKLRNTILSVLFLGLAISFVFFTLFGFRALTDHDEDNTLTQSIFNRAYALPLIIGCIGIAASLSAHLIFKSQKNQQTQQAIHASNKIQISALEEAMFSNIQILDALKAFYGASNFVSRDEFRSFVTPLLKKNKALQALEWVPKVENTKRKEYERNIRSEGLSSFRITQRNQQDEIEAASIRETYFPASYVEPLINNEESVGFDLASHPRCLAALNKARDTDEAAITARITLVQGKEKQVGLLVFNPIYENDKNYNTPKERKKHLQGYVLSVLRVNNIINQALGKNLSKTSIFVEDITDPNNPESLYGSFEDSSMNADFISEVTLNIGGRQWRIKAFPNPALLKNTTSGLPWIILFGGLIFTLLITYTFIQLIRRRQVIEGVVRARTREIADSKQFQDTIMSNIPDLLFVKDDEFKIVEANPAFLNVYPAHMRDTVIGTTTLESYSDEAKEEFLKHDKEALETGSSQNEELIKFPDGITRALLTKKVRFEDLQGKPFILGIARDITDLKKAEEEILRSNIELERFAYVASHDLQEPLRMVTNFTGLLKKQYEDKLDDAAIEYINFASDGAKRMQALVNDLLEYSRIGQEVENFKDVDLNEIMKIIEANLKDSIDSTKAKIIYDPLPIVHANPIRMIRVLQNLIGNSIKYQEADVTPEIHITVEQQGSIWKISIKDNGIGMKQEYCEKIFEPFKRLHGKNEYTGTGIGLAICRKVIEGFGGEIWAESKLDEGSTFHFTLPANTE